MQQAVDCPPKQLAPASPSGPPAEPGPAPTDELDELVERLTTLGVNSEDSRPDVVPPARRPAARIGLFIVGDLTLSLPMTASLGGFSSAGAFIRTAPAVAAFLATVYVVAYRLHGVMAARSRRADGASPEVPSAEEPAPELVRPRAPVV